MPLVEQEFPLTLTQGINTKQDPKTIKAKLLRLQDAVFTQETLSKRNGYTKITNAIAGGGTLTAPKFNTSFKDELLVQDGGLLYAYSASAACWVAKGPYVSGEVNKQEISSALNAQVFQDSATVGNYGIFSYTQLPVDSVTLSSGNSNSGCVTVRDLSTGTDLVTSSILNSNTSDVLVTTKTFVIATTKSAVVYPIVAGSTGTLKMVYYTITSSGATPSSAATVSSSGDVSQVFAMNIGGNVTSAFVFDAAGTSTGGVVAYGRTTGPALEVKTFDSSGVVTATYNQTGAVDGGIKGVSLCVDSSNGNIWVHYVSGTNRIIYLVLDSSLNVLRAATQVATPGAAPVYQITAVSVSTTQQEVYYSLNNNSNTVTNVFSFTNLTQANITKAIVNLNGTFSVTSDIARNMDIASRPFRYGGSTYFCGIYRSSTQGSVYILNGSGTYIGKPIAKLQNAGQAYSYLKSQLQTGVVVGAAVTICGFVASVCGLTANKFGFNLAETAQTDSFDLNTFAQLSQSSFYTMDFASQEAYQSFESEGGLLLNGGIVWQYDGASTTELGFNLYPEITAAVVSNGGNLSEGSYEYIAILQWVDGLGRLHQSAYRSILATTTSTNKTVTLTIQTPQISYKSTATRPRLAIFRSQVNVGNVLTLITTLDYGSTVNYTTYADTASDASIIGADALYTNGGVIENTAPPAAVAFAGHNNRVWLIDSTNKNTLSYSKTLQPGVGISFSDLFTYQVNATAGNCVAIAGMDSNLVVLEEKQPLVIQGDGANDAGTGSTLTPAQPIPSDAGCTTSKGIIVFPGGVLRKTAKGIYLLDRSLSDKYWGYDVEAYNSQTIVSTTLLKDKTQIRFLSSDGVALVYDYFFNQWSTFTNHLGYSATIYQNQYTYLRTSGELYQESSGYYLDDTVAIAPLGRTGWLTMSQIQNFERVKQLLLLGNYAGASTSHGMQISFAYDFSETFTAINPYYFNNSDNPPVYQFRGFLPKQKCDAVSILFQEITTGASDESVTFTDMSFIAAIKKGLNKKSAANSVG